MIPLIAIRPEPGCTATVAAARALGLAVEGFPLFAVRALEWDAPTAGDFDALLAGSANVFRHGGQRLAAYRSLPVHAVGQTTADAAREAGFAIGQVGSGGLQRVLDEVPAGTHLLRLAGAERIELVPPTGVTLIERTVYASEALPMPDDLAARLAQPCVVLLHSAEAARHFAMQCAARNVGREAIRLACIGPRVTAAAGDGWAAAVTASRPDETALLAKAAELCHT